MRYAILAALILAAGCGPSAQAEYDAALGRLDAEQREFARLDDASRKSFDEYMGTMRAMTKEETWIEENPHDDEAKKYLVDLKARFEKEKAAYHTIADQRTAQEKRVETARGERDAARKRLNK